MKCPQCARTFEGWSEQPENKNLDLTLDDYQILLEPFSKDSFRILHCGNFGDALASPTFDETFDYTMSRSPNQVMIMTNGCLRGPTWWRELAQRGQGRLKVVFSVDGLEDTNSIYRVGSNFKSFLANAKAFLDEGGKARWDFIEFKHNYHQIEQAQQLAKDMGFDEFNVKYTARFASVGNKAFVNKKGQGVEDVSSNVNQQDRDEVLMTYGSLAEYAEKTSVSCKTQERKSVFVDMNMRLWPCCWFGVPLYMRQESVQKESFRSFLKLYEKDFNDLRVHGWRVLEHEFFTQYLEKSWNDPSDKFKRIYTCGRTCGEKFEFSSGHGKNRNIKVLRANC